MSDTVISVEHLSKRYTIRHQKSDNGIRHVIHELATAPLRWLSARSAKRQECGAVESWGLGNELQNHQPTMPNAEELTLDTHYVIPNAEPPISNGNGSLGSGKVSTRFPTPTTQSPTPDTEEFWALKDVSFEAKRGEVVGIIGRNGAGKSTLLKILSRITEPTEGRVRIRGRLASLLEVGTGFHPELTGRENIFVNGAILGMTRAEVQKKFDEIVDFAEVEQFLDMPVKRYSSGMHVRLAFAVAAHLEPDILLVDEVLAVGDVRFQKKCTAKMANVSSGGKLVLMVSHNVSVVQALCSRALLIERGRLLQDAGPESTIARYLNELAVSTSHDLAVRKDRTGSGGSRLTKIDIISSERCGSFVTGQRVRFEFHVDRFWPSLICRFSIYNQTGQPLCEFSSQATASHNGHRSGNPDGFVCEIDSLLLLPARYRIDVALFRNGELLDMVEDAAAIEIGAAMVDGAHTYSPYSSGAQVYMPHRWHA